MTRIPLPIDGRLDEIVEVMRRSSSVVVEAPPGAGKTTRVPVALANQGLADDGLIVVLQPRRVAARAAARRVAAENSWRLGNEVGYQVRFDRRWGRHTRILFVTEGIFLAMLQSDPFLEKVCVVVFDEFHERSLDADLALAMVRRVQAEARPDLRLVVMSATLESAPITAFLGGCPTILVTVPTHPIEVKYLNRPVEGDPARAAAAAVERNIDRTDGDILVFLPGVAWIRRCVKELEQAARKKNLALFELHGSLSPEQQDRALEPCDRTKVVVATNIAETSLTIDGVRCVVDSGLARSMRFDRGAAVNRLETGRISRSSAVQRAGRAGRQGPGVCLRMWTEAEDAGLREAETPEIRRLDLSGGILQLLAWGEPDVRDFPWFETPPPRALDEAMEVLRWVGAVDGAGLTPRGRVMAKLPLQPRMACLLVEGWQHGSLDIAAWSCAALSEGLAPGRGTVNLFETAIEATSHHAASGNGHPRRILKVRDELQSLVTHHLGPAPAPETSDVDAFALAALAAYPDRLVRRRSAEPGRGVMVGNRGVRIDDPGTFTGHDLLVAIEVLAGDRGRSTEAFVTHAVPIRKDNLPRRHLSSAVETEFDTSSGRVHSFRRLRWLDLVLDERHCGTTDENEAALVLAQAAAESPEKILGLDREPAAYFLARLRSLAAWRPDLDLPTFDTKNINELLPSLCHGKRSLAELGRLPMAEILSGLLSGRQRAALDREAPERIRVPSGSRIRLSYEPGKPPVLAARIQELFGLARTPTVAGGRVPVTLHLLAPNMRPQQVTTDLASFWENTYPEVRSELRGRYPKHHWPEDPLTAQATSRTRRRK